ncbi:MAG: type VI secretion system lipoprotein TssJ [Deltaproteobacteria bacterium]|nr:type VI secretion system lipoprotein TssJ [Nannocystaceae bacterium]
MATAMIGGCKKKDDGPSCNPEDKAKFKVNVLVQPQLNINPDENGEALPTVMRFYQLDSDESLATLDFADTWQKGKEVFGDSFLAEDERQIFPGKPETIEIEPDEKTAFILAVALFREPTGINWYRLWEKPKYHGDSVCLAERAHKTWADPCFYIVLDRSVVDGGHTPPPGFDKSKTTLVCPGPPLKVKPPAPETGKKKKKKKKPDLKKAKEASETKPPEGPTAPEAPAAPEAPSAPGAPEAPAAPGKG